MRILFTIHGLVVTVHAAVVAVAFAVANTAAVFFSVVVQNFNPTAIIAGFTMISAALMGSIKILTPVLVEAIRSIGPALAELQKQREDLRKGSLSYQMEQMSNKLHDMELAAEMAARSHAIELQGISLNMESARLEAARLREENLKLTKMVAHRAEIAITQSAINADNIKVMARDSGTFAVVPPVSMDDLMGEPMPHVEVPSKNSPGGEAPPVGGGSPSTA